MRKITLFTFALAVSVVIGIDTWLRMRTLTPGALAGASPNRLSIAAGAKASPISHYPYKDYLLVTD